MTDLPTDRVRISKPFSHCAVDYAGPIKLKVWTDARGIAMLRKAWIAVFKCMWTKATHLELVTDCTTGFHSFNEWKPSGSQPNAIRIAAGARDWPLNIQSNIEKDEFLANDEKNMLKRPMCRIETERCWNTMTNRIKTTEYNMFVISVF